MIREPQLDDRTFQQLVDEARTRITSVCPEWSEHNVSDPGITLIEQFAWMVELLLYRVNRLPEKVHVALLALLGVELQPPVAARTDVQFLLGAPQPDPVRIPVTASVSTTPGEHEQPVVFRVSESVVIPVLDVNAAAVQRGTQLTRLPVHDGVVRPPASDRAVFAETPAPGDALYLGFQRSLARVIVRLQIDAQPAFGTGVRPDAPPLEWEVSQANNVWEPAEVLDDRTGGLNYQDGEILLQLPPLCRQIDVGGRRRYWLRCRVVEPDGETPPYKSPPHVVSARADALGALVPTEHSFEHEDEIIGYHDGTPGKTFRVRHAPTLPLDHDEGLQVYDAREKEWVDWERRDTLGDSRATDQHYTYDAARGEVRIGAAVRDRGGWVQHGAIPPPHTALRMSKYRHGGGVAGNVPPRTLVKLRETVPGVASVTNPLGARGGLDLEDIEAARERAIEERRTAARAVTARDFEIIAESRGGVARSKCLVPAPGEAVPVRILPAVPDPAGRLLKHPELDADERLRESVRRELAERSLLGTSVDVTPARLHPIAVMVQVRRRPASAADEVRREIERALYDHLSPLVGPDERGWPWGGTFRLDELYPVVRGVSGVQSIELLRCYRAGVPDLQPTAEEITAPLTLEPDALVVSGIHEVRVDL